MAFLKAGAMGKLAHICPYSAIGHDLLVLLPVPCSSYSSWFLRLLNRGIDEYLVICL